MYIAHNYTQCVQVARSVDSWLHSKKATVGSAISNDTRVQDRATRPIQLKVKEALHIQNTLANNRLNRDGDYELLGCWITTTKKLGGSAQAMLVLTALVLQPPHQTINMRTQAQKSYL